MLPILTPQFSMGTFTQAQLLSPPDGNESPVLKKRKTSIDTTDILNLTIF
jgi:hypothetical protein